MVCQQSKLAIAYNKGVVNVRKSLSCSGEVVIKFPDNLGVADIFVTSLEPLNLMDRKNVSVIALKQSNLAVLIRNGHIDVI